VDLFAPVCLERAELPHQFAAFLVFRRGLAPGIIADIEGHIPFEWGRAGVIPEFALPDRLGQAFAVVLQIGSHMGIAEGPDAERGRWMGKSEHVPTMPEGG
ncbi:MAG TPA: hypothetical protein PLU30_27910, partial [Verrucomicrobiae bacterium]|nr:hypothetical protein [Verrucomicrobiae bacterium]